MIYGKFLNSGVFGSLGMPLLRSTSALQTAVLEALRENLHFVLGVLIALWQGLRVLNPEELGKSNLTTTCWHMVLLPYAGQHIWEAHVACQGIQPWRSGP